MSSGSFSIGFAIGAALSPSVASVFSTVENRVRATSQRVESLNRQTAMAARASELRANITQANRTLAANGGRDDMARQVLQGNLRAYQSLRVEAERYGLNLETISHNQARANTELARAETRLHALTQAQASQNRRKEIRGQMMEAIVPALAVAAPVRAAVQFESAMADAAKTIDGMRDASGNLTPKYYEMETAIKRMGRELPLTHEQLAGLFAAGGQQGMTGVDELREFTTMAAHMSVAFGMSTEEAADAIGGYRTAMHLSMPETRSMLDLMNQFANTTSATEKGIADVVRRIGPLGNVGGVAAKPMTALAATLDAMKVSPEIAATGIKNLILSLTSGEAATKGQKEAFAKLGIDTVKLAQQMQKDGPAAIISVLEAVKQLPKAQQLSIMQEIFGKESIAAISPLLDSLDLVKRNLVIASDETLYAGAMQKEFENRSRTTANALIIAGNKTRELGVTIGSVLLPAVNDILDAVGPVIIGMADWAEQHKTLTTVIVGAVAGFMALRVAGLAGAYVFHTLAGAFNIGRATLALFVPSLAASTSASDASRVSALRAGAAWLWHKAVMVGGAAVSGVMAAAQWALNTAFLACPLTWVVLAIGAVVGAMAYLYNTCEPVRALFDTVFGWIGDKVDWVGGKLRTVAEWLGLVDEADETADKKTEELQNKTAAPPEALGASAPKPSAIPPAFSAAMPTAPEALQPPGQPDAAVLAAMNGNGPAGLPGAGANVSASFQFSISGITDSALAKRVIKAIEQNKGEFERLLSQIVHDQERLAYE